MSTIEITQPTVGYKKIATLTAKANKFSDIHHGHTPVTVAGTAFIQLPMQEFLETDPIPTNRDSLRRVPKMKFTFISAYTSKQSQTLTEVAIGIVRKDFIDPVSDKEYKTGEWYVIDGNTRQHFWRQNPDYADQHTQGITAKIHYLESMKDVEFAYYPYNNVKSVEKASDILTGLARRYNWTPRQSMFQNGGYKTAIDWAAFTPGEDNKDIYGAFHACFEGLRALDATPKDGDNSITKPYLVEIKSQAIIAAFLTALRFNPGNLRVLAMVERLSTMTMDELRNAIARGKLDACHIIAAEYTGMSVLRSDNGTAKEPWLRGHAKSTKFESREIQMDFLLYWIDKYVSNPKSEYSFNKGIKTTAWNGFWYSYFPEEE
jgi:hypothetical protein